MTGPWIAEVEDCSDEYIEKNAKKLRTMIYFGGKDGDLYKAFKSSAQHTAISDRYDFIHFEKDECAKKFSIETGAPTIAITRTYEESPVFYYGPATEDDLADFAYNESIPTLVDVN